MMIENIISFIEKNLNVIKILPEDMCLLKLKFEYLNCKSLDETLNYGEMDFISYKVIKDNKSKIFYAGNLIEKEDKNPIIEILIEKRTGYITASEQLLKIILNVKKGISKNDLEKRNDNYHEYMEWIEIAQNELTESQIKTLDLTYELELLNTSQLEIR